MTPEETAAATTAAVSGIAANFMLDPGTYAKGAAAGFQGLDFYAAGRGGVLGPVDADVVAAAFAFFEPGSIRANWELALQAMDPAEAAQLFIRCGHEWADEHLGDDVDWSRLAELVGRVNRAANPALAPLFAAWRAAPEPQDGSDKALALHRLNVLRELRNALHAAAVVGHGLAPVEALLVKTPYMAPVFGWTDALPEVGEEHHALHAAAEQATNRALAPAYAALGADERAELASLCAAAVGAVA